MRKFTPRERLQKLRDDLLKAHREIKATNGDTDAYAIALMSVATFLRDERAEHKDGEQKHRIGECAQWIEALARQLGDRGRTGYVGPLLQSDTNPGNTVSSLVQKRRLLVAAGVKALIISRLSREEAARQAISKVKAIKDTSWKRVLSWMDEFGRTRSSLAHMFQHMMKVAQTNPKLMAEVYFHHANELGGSSDW